MEINLLIEEDVGGSIETDWLDGVAEKVLVAQNADTRVELGLVILGEEKIRKLNLDYLGKDEPTDVLSFSMLPEQSAGENPSFVAPPDGVQHLGEVIISYPQAVIQAGEHQHPVKRELAILVIHGVLHLLGYDHEEPVMEQEMRDREMEILRCIEEELK